MEIFCFHFLLVNYDEINKIELNWTPDYEHGTFHCVRNINMSQHSIVKHAQCISIFTEVIV